MSSLSPPRTCICPVWTLRHNAIEKKIIQYEHWSRSSEYTQSEFSDFILERRKRQRLQHSLTRALLSTSQHKLIQYCLAHWQSIPVVGSHLAASLPTSTQSVNTINGDSSSEELSLPEEKIENEDSKSAKSLGKYVTQFDFSTWHTEYMVTPISESDYFLANRFSRRTRANSCDPLLLQSTVLDKYCHKVNQEKWSNSALLSSQISLPAEMIFSTDNNTSLVHNKDTFSRSHNNSSPSLRFQRSKSSERIVSETDNKTNSFFKESYDAFYWRKAHTTNRVFKLQQSYTDHQNMPRGSMNASWSSNQMSSSSKSVQDNEFYQQDALSLPVEKSNFTDWTLKCKATTVGELKSRFEFLDRDSMYSKQTNRYESSSRSPKARSSIYLNLNGFPPSTKQSLEHVPANYKSAASEKSQLFSPAKLSYTESDAHQVSEDGNYRSAAHIVKPLYTTLNRPVHTANHQIKPAMDISQIEKQESKKYRSRPIYKKALSTTSRNRPKSEELSTAALTKGQFKSTPALVVSNEDAVIEKVIVPSQNVRSSNNKRKTSQSNLCDKIVHSPMRSFQKSSGTERAHRPNSLGIHSRALSKSMQNLHTSQLFSLPSPSTHGSSTNGFGSKHRRRTFINDWDERDPYGFSPRQIEQRIKDLRDEHLVHADQQSRVKSIAAMDDLNLEASKPEWIDIANQWQRQREHNELDRLYNVESAMCNPTRKFFGKDEQELVDNLECFERKTVNAQSNNYYRMPKAQEIRTYSAAKVSNSRSDSNLAHHNSSRKSSSFRPDNVLPRSVSNQNQVTNHHSNNVRPLHIDVSRKGSNYDNKMFMRTPIPVHHLAYQSNVPVRTSENRYDTDISPFTGYCLNEQKRLTRSQNLPSGSFFLNEQGRPYYGSPNSEKHSSRPLSEQGLTYHGSPNRPRGKTLVKHL